MKFAVTGATGLLGSRLVPYLMSHGHQVIALTRDPEAHRFPAGVQAVRWDATSPLVLPGGADVIVNLLGERVIGKRWTEEQVGRIRDSRLVATRRIAEWILAKPAGSRPVLVNANAVGYYGAAPEGPCPETRDPGADFLARLCKEWQDAALASGGRVVVLRFGHILDMAGGYLGALLPFARLGGAGPIAGGKQPMPWVHWQDVCGAILWAGTRPSASGAYNVVAPGAAGMRQGAFAKAFGRSIGRPMQLPVPGLAMRARFGAKAAPVLVGGQDARPVRLEAEGFAFRHPQLAPALADLTSRK